MSTSTAREPSSMSDLPSHILVDILSRLPIKNIIHCRCVCKTWHSLLSDSYFANMHISRSPTSIMVNKFGVCESNMYNLVDLEDEPDHHRLHHDPAMTFELGGTFPNYGTWLVGSANGLLCLWHFDGNDATCIFNPITRECATLPKHKYFRQSYAIVNYGFGVSSMSGRYKVVRIFQGKYPNTETGVTKSEGEIYTLGTGTWRSLGHVPFPLGGRQVGQFLRGSLHWLSFNDHDIAICCFDIEKESFELIPSPPADEFSKDVPYQIISLGVLGGRLCICDNSTNSEILIWVMKDYGVRESWTKEIVIQKQNSELSYEVVHPLKVLKDGSILMLWREDFLFTHNPQTKTWQEEDTFEPNFDAILYVPGFLSLRNFAMETIVVF